ncbi:hypothetical protein DPMN_095083 [Dreissena polymorpha]|uniref:Uncharacterized protein n=1 Tax=Dreissena polymorpha TaxID=45954 RepID=A0A9D4R3G5_DREPO|nr:hypothetical protein DPMN_095083 [Dreissena polymorpha]
MLLTEVTAGQLCYVLGKEYNVNVNTTAYTKSYTYCKWGCCDYRTGCCEHYNGDLFGGILGGVFGLVLLGTILAACCEKRKRRLRAPQGQVLSTANVQPVNGAPGTQTAYAQQPYQPYRIQTTNMLPGYGSAYTQPMQSLQPPLNEEVNKGMKSWQPPKYEEVEKGLKP